MTAIAPGTPLICVRDDWTGPDGSCKKAKDIRKGSLYFCSAVEEVRRVDGCGVCLWVRGPHTFVYLKGKEHKYCIKRFRPLNDGDTSLVDAEERNRKAKEVLAYVNFPTKEKVNAEDHPLPSEQARPRRLEPA